MSDLTREQEQYVTDTYELLKKQIQEGKLSPEESTLLLLLSRTMEIMEKAPQASGEAKKKMTIKTTMNIYHDFIKTNDKIDQNVAKLFFNELSLALTIDIIIAATKGEFQINKKISGIKKLFGKCCH